MSDDPKAQVLAALSAHVGLNQVKSQGGQGVPRPQLERVMGGVTSSWLAQVFGLDAKIVKSRLAGCPALTEGNETGRGYQGRTYELKVAAPYLVQPKISAANFMKAIKKAELPPALQQSFWDAMLKRQKFEENAGDLWRTDKIREVLGSSFQTIKFTMQLWVDTVERNTGMTGEQRKMIIQLVDALQGDIYEALVAKMQTDETGNQLSELPAILNESEEMEITDDNALDAEAEALI